MSLCRKNNIIGEKKLFEIFTSGDIHKQSISYPLSPWKLGITELFRVEKLEDQWENICMIYYPDGK